MLRSTVVGARASRALLHRATPLLSALANNKHDSTCTSSRDRQRSAASQAAGSFAQHAQQSLLRQRRPSGSRAFGTAVESRSLRARALFESIEADLAAVRSEPSVDSLRKLHASVGLALHEHKFSAACAARFLPDRGNSVALKALQNAMSFVDFEYTSLKKELFSEELSATVQFELPVGDSALAATAGAAAEPIVLTCYFRAERNKIRNMGSNNHELRLAREADSESILIDANEHAAEVDPAAVDHLVSQLKTVHSALTTDDVKWFLAFALTFPSDPAFDVLSRGLADEL